MNEITPLHKRQYEYSCKCGGPIFKKEINYNDVHWICGACYEQAVVDISEYPAHFVFRPASAHGDAPYIITERVVKDRHYNPNYGDDRMCKCGHPYYRHFDSYEEMYPCGCKYCDCFTFEEALTPSEK